MTDETSDDQRRRIGASRGAAGCQRRRRTVPADPAERALHQMIIRAFAATGGPPNSTALEQAAARTPARPPTCWSACARPMLFGSGPAVTYGRHIRSRGVGPAIVSGSPTGW